MEKIYKTEIIDNYLKENKISKTEFCKRCGVSYAFLKNIYLQNKNISLIRYAKICKFLKLKFYDLFY